MPRLEWLEGFIAADPDFFGPGSLDVPQFDQTGVLRGDLETEADISLKKVQSGQWLVDEARARDGLQPLPNGAGQIPQSSPSAAAPTPPRSKRPARQSTYSHSSADCPARRPAHPRHREARRPSP